MSKLGFLRAGLNQTHKKFVLSFIITRKVPVLHRGGGGGGGYGRH